MRGAKGEAKEGGQRGGQRRRPMGEAKGVDQKRRPKGETKGGGQRRWPKG